MRRSSPHIRREIAVMQVRRIVNVLAVGIIVVGTTTACATKKFVRTEVERSAPGSKRCRSRSRRPRKPHVRTRRASPGRCEGRSGRHLGEGRADLGRHRATRAAAAQLAAKVDAVDARPSASCMKWSSAKIRAIQVRIGRAARSCPGAHRRDDRASSRPTRAATTSKSKVTPTRAATR